MCRVVFSLVLAAGFLLSPDPGSAQQSPQQLAKACRARCDNANKACVRRCDAGPSINKNKCYVGCENTLDSCYAGCGKVESCGETFKTCTKPKAQCIKDYNDCKSR